MYKILSNTSYYGEKFWWYSQEMLHIFPFYNPSLPLLFLMAEVGHIIKHKQIMKK